MNYFKRFFLQFRQARSLPFGKTEHVIKFAFSVGDVDYYEFDTTANLPYKRAMAFFDIYEELNMKCDRYYLTKLCEAILSQFAKPKIGFEEMANIKKWIQQTQERLSFIYQPDLVYKLASVVFFDANENPNTYEWKYNAEKIERWKKSQSATDFFSSEPMTRLLPFLKDSSLSSQTYLEALEKLDKMQLENILSNVSGSQASPLPTYTERLFYREMNQNTAP